MENCIFCKLAKEKSQGIIYKNDNFFSIPDVKPIAEGHSLVISKSHFKTALDLPDSLGTELVDCIKNTALKVIEKTKAEGFNIIGNNFPAAGQVVHHFHMHIIPRRKGDGVKLR